MTTVAIKDGKMASDSRVVQESRIIGTTKKIHNFKKYAIGAAGTLHCITAFVEWFEQGADKESFPEEIVEDTEGFDALVYFKDTKELLYFCDKPYGDKIDSPYHAVGTGAPYALGAMAAGKSAAQAVLIASQFDIYTDVVVQEYDLVK